MNCQSGRRQSTIQKEIHAKNVDDFNYNKGSISLKTYYTFHILGQIELIINKCEFFFMHQNILDGRRQFGNLLNQKEMH